MPKCTYNDEKHEYKIDGVIVSSVTGAIGVWVRVGAYACNTITGAIIPIDRFNAASDHGEAVHKIAELYFNGLSVDEKELHAELVPSYTALKVFRDKYRVRPVLVEQNMFSEKFEYGGTPDLVAFIRNPQTGADELAGIDFKTSKVNLGILGQLAAYDNLIQEHADLNIEAFYTVGLIKGEDTVRLKRYDREQLAVGWRFFKACLYRQKYLLQG
jgi:hypothetical protein